MNLDRPEEKNPTSTCQLQAKPCKMEDAQEEEQQGIDRIQTLSTDLGTNSCHSTCFKQKSKVAASIRNPKLKKTSMR